MKASAVFNDAFLVCHEIYQAARELVNSRVPTTQLTSASKFLWRPDLRPRLVEYVADFARAGERALEETGLSKACRDSRTPKSRGNHAAFGAQKVPRASRLILFRLYYLGGAEYQAARHLLGLSERTWSDWAEEVRQRVGAELVRARMYPPARYFREPAISAGGTVTPLAPTRGSAAQVGDLSGCAVESNGTDGTAKIRCATKELSLGAAESTNDAGEAKIHCCEQDFA